jgi:hypothetical protein
MHPTDRLYTYRCPECRKDFTYDQPAEPMCDGPGETKSHEPKVMHRIRVKDREQTVEVSPEEGAARAKGTLLTPEALVAMKAKVRGRLWTPKDGIDPWTGEEMDDRAE